MTKTISTEVVRKALENAVALELAAQTAWEQRSRAVDLFESGRRPRSETDGSSENREI